MTPPWNIRPASAEAKAYVAALPLPVRAVARTLDGAVRDTIPGVRVGMKWAVPFYYSKGAICYVSAAQRHVTFGLVNGDKISDASGFLTGTGKSPIRKATFRVGDEVPEKVVTAWLRQAKKLDAYWGEDMTP